MKVILIGNYPPDRQRSMAAFAQMLHENLAVKGITTEIIQPQPRLGKSGNAHPTSWRKWAGYVDKFFFFPALLRRKVREHQGQKVVFHIVDHSNAMYGKPLKKAPYVVTCHDMLAVRGGLGDVSAYCQASRTGTVLQKWILSSLKNSRHIGCVSDTTKQDLERLTQRRGDDSIRTVPNAINAPFSPMTADSIRSHLPAAVRDLGGLPYVLMVGSALPRKNRETALRAIASLQGRWQGVLVVAGQKLNGSQRQLAATLGIQDKIIEVEGPDHQQLNALYAGAHALFFPSYAEGFGWPIIEAQASNCPVICSDLTAVPEVAGKAALVCRADDIEAFATSIVRLQNEPGLRERLIEQGRENLDRFSMEKMLDGYVHLYTQALAAQTR